MTDRRRGPWVLLAALVAGLLLAVTSPALSASAAPGDGAGGAPAEGSPTLAEVLESTARGYIDAQHALEASKRRQAEIAAQAAKVEVELRAKSGEAEGIAAVAYRTGKLGTASAMLDSQSPERFLDRATVMQGYATRNDHELRELSRLRRELTAARTKIDAEVSVQEQQVATMAQKKQEAEKALALAGGRATGGFVSVTSPLAAPAPRRADGSWPPERCTIDDPTTTGCITARMLHSLQQAKSAGFTRYVACFRPAKQFEHPKGRACDFSAEVKSFGGVAAGADKTYGSNLAAYFVRNADQLGVLYVIWFKQVWTPAAGWHSYSGGNGDPSSDHTNHVHLSVY
jgi:peptidoglycan DL-endopeptidase CwlO